MATRDPNRALQERLKMLQQEADLLEQIRREEERIDELRKQQKDNSESLQLARREVFELSREEITSLEQEKILAEEQIILEETSLRNAQEQFAAVQRIVEARKSSNSELSKEAEQLAESLGITDDLLEQLEEEVELRETNLSIAKRHNQQLAIAQANVEDFASLLGVASNVNETWLGRVETTARAAGSITESISSYGPSLRTTFSPANVLASIVEKVAESTIAIAFEMDSVVADLNRATGAGGQFNEVIDDVRFGSLQAGVGLGASADSVQALFQNFSDFTSLSREAQTDITRTTALLTRLGISADTTARSMDLAVNSLGMNVDQALMLQREIAQTAIELGRPPQQLAEDFVSSLPQLAKYGAGSVQIFKELEAQSKATGIAYQSLLGIAGQFDTFESASQAAGRLNAMLGGNLLNSVELLTATESERIQLLRESVQASGRSWDALNRFEKQAIAASAGINDMTEAAKLFGTSDEEFLRVQQAQDAEAMSIAALTESASQSTSVQEKMKLIMEGLSGAALPLVMMLQSIVTSILEVNDALGGALIPIIVFGIGGLLTFTKVVQGLIAAKAAYTAVTTFLTGAQAAETAASTASTTASIAETAATSANTVAQTTNTVARSTSIVSIIASNAAKVASIALVVGEYIALGILNGIMWLAVIAYGAWTTAQWLINAAMTANPIGLIIVGIGALIAAIAALIIYYDDINGWIQETTGGLLDFWDVLLLVAGVILGPIGAGLFIAKQLYDHWDAVVGVFDTASQWVTDLTGGFMDLWDVLLLLMSPMAWIISNADKVFKSFPDLGNVIPGFAGGTTNFGGGLAVVGERGPELVSLPGGSNVITNENTKKITEAGAARDRAAVGLQEKTIIAQEKLADAVDKAPSRRPGSGDDGPKEIVLKIDGREFARAVVDAFDGEMKLNLVRN